MERNKNIVKEVGKQEGNIATSTRRIEAPALCIEPNAQSQREMRWVWHRPRRSPSTPPACSPVHPITRAPARPAACMHACRRARRLRARSPARPPGRLPARPPARPFLRLPVSPPLLPCAHRDTREGIRLPPKETRVYQAPAEPGAPARVHPATLPFVTRRTLRAYSPQTRGPRARPSPRPSGTRRRPLRRPCRRRSVRPPP